MFGRTFHLPRMDDAYSSGNCEEEMLLHKLKGLPCRTYSQGLPICRIEVSIKGALCRSICGTLITWGGGKESAYAPGGCQFRPTCLSKQPL